VQFATPVEAQVPAMTAPVPAAPVVTAPPAASYPQPVTVAPGPAPVVAAPAAPAGTAVMPPVMAPQPGTYTPPPSYNLPPAAPTATAVQPPPANWDPYATPGTGPSPLMSQDPCIPAVAAPVTVATMQKLVQHIDVDYHWFAGSNSPNELGINDAQMSCTFAFPLFFNPATPLLVTPGFGIQLWNGPASVGTPPAPPPPDLPPQTYDAFLDAAWNPQVNCWFGGEFDARIGVYSDFNNVTNDAIRFTGQGLAVLTFSPSVKVKAGVWYLNRNAVKILPAGGICWTPNPDVYFNILFPNPKIAKRLTTWGCTDWWIYFAGEYGGGKWQITRDNGLSPNPYVPNMNGATDTFDYNDIRIGVGLEFNTPRQLHGMFEVGGAFDREVIYQSYQPHAFYPNNTVYLRGGVSY
jgi:hypothetical protein